MRSSPTSFRWGLLVLASIAACKTERPAGNSFSAGAVVAGGTAARVPARATASKFDKILPEAASPFVAATPIQLGSGYVRRGYVAGRERVEITIAHFAQNPDAFERWVAGSVNYPQAQLALPAAQANGFYSCASDLADAPCDLHIQLRSGFHVEVMGNGRVQRQELAEFMTHIPLGELSESTLAAP